MRVGCPIRQVGNQPLLQLVADIVFHSFRRIMHVIERQPQEFDQERFPQSVRANELCRFAATDFSESYLGSPSIDLP